MTQIKKMIHGDKMNSVKDSFDKQGYIVVEKFLNTDEVLELQKQTERFVQEVVPGIPPEEVFYEIAGDKSSLKQVQKLYEFDDYFLGLAQSKKVVDLAEACLGGPVDLVNMQYFNKAPKIGKGTPAHQDGHYFKIKPQEAVTMWLSLGKADKENGAVSYVRGSHLKGMRDHKETKVLGFSQGLSEWRTEDGDNEVQMTAEAGDILVHHSLTIHKAPDNLSDRHRKSVGFIFYRADVVVDESERSSYKKNVMDDLKKREVI